MKIFFGLIILCMGLFLKAEPLRCETASGILNPILAEPAMKSLKNFISAARALGMVSGDQIKTLVGQTTTLHFLKPTEHSITILENSVVEMRAPLVPGCQGALLISRGRVISEGEHGAVEKNKKCLTQAEIETPNTEVIPRGTKYSVDLNSAIAEANGESIIETENYSVEKGSIQIKSKKIN